MQDFRVKSGLRVSGNVYGVDYLTANNINVTYNGIFGNLTVNGSIVGNVTGTVSSLANQTTSNLAEGTNQYFTNARAYANLTAASINALADVDTVTNPPDSGYGLVWDGNAWVPSVITVSGTELANVANTVVGIVQGSLVANTAFFANVAGVANLALRANVATLADSANTALRANVSTLADSANISLRANVATLADEANIAGFADVADSVNSISNFTTANLIESTGNLYFTNARTIGAITNQDITLNNLTLSGDLIVQGNTVTLNTATVTVEDKNILLANGALNAAVADGAGLSIAGANANLIYKYSTNSFDINKDLTITGNILPTVGNLFDLGSNEKPFRDLWLYGSSIKFSNSGSISQLANTIVVTDANNNVILTANSTNIPITSPTGRLTAELITNVPGLTTANIAEGSNLYYTNARVEAAIQPTVAELRALVSRFNSNVLYVAQNGNDANDGRTMGNAFANIHVALAAATQWTTVFLKSGDYRLHNQPVTIPRRVALVGDNLRTTTIRPTQPSVDMFYVENASYVTGITFRDHVSPAAVFSYNPNGSAGTIVTSPYIQNCSSITTTGTGMRVDGRYVSGLRSMVCDAYTQTNEGGIGIHMLNKGYTQLVSVFTICCNIAIKCENGGFCSVTNSNASFGTYGLWADGVSEPLYYGKVQTGTTEATNQITLSNLSIKPNYGDAVLFANYNQEKCARDTGLIVDSLAFDLAYNSNTQSTFAGLQYWAQPTSAIPNQSVETINAINVAAQIAVQFASGTSVSQVYQSNVSPSNGTGGTAVESARLQNNFNVVTNIIQNGTVGVTDTIVPNQYPANTNVNVSNAANLVIANKAFIAAEVIGYIDSTYPGFWANTAFLNSANAQAKCSRDVGYILESVTFDLRHGGNRQSVTSGTYYYQYDATDTQINDQVVQTGAAYYFIGNLVDNIIRGNVIANVYQTAVTQNTTAAAYATRTEANLLLDDVRLIANIVTFGPNVAYEKQPITFTPSSNTNIINATTLVLANKNFIKAEVLEFVNQNWANISNGASTFYTVRAATELVSNVSTITLLETVTESILANSRVSFHQGSYISSSGHTFEYVGSGNQIATALPSLGGVPIQENEVKELRGGKVYFTSTDQLGDFRIGTGLVINRVDGTITGRTFNKALFAVMTPYLLAIEG